jgi:hypothetical protein
LARHLPLWGGAMRCQRSIRRDFFSSLLDVKTQYFCGLAWWRKFQLAAEGFSLGLLSDFLPN